MGITILAVLHVLQAIVFFVGSLLLILVAEVVRRGPFAFVPLNLFRGILSVVGVVLMFVSILYLGLAYGLWTGKGWAWWISLILAGLGIIGSLLSLVRGRIVSILILVLDVIIVYYLFRPNVKAFFHKQTSYPQQPRISTTQPAVSSQTTPTSYCTNCGAPLTSGGKFCPNCGKTIA